MTAIQLPMKIWESVAVLLIGRLLYPDATRENRHGDHAKRTMVMLSIVARHTGHAARRSAHAWHVAIWPQGLKRQRDQFETAHAHRVLWATFTR